MPQTYLYSLQKFTVKRTEDDTEKQECFCCHFWEQIGTMLNFVLSLLCIIPFSLEGACSPFLFSAVWALCMGPWLGESARAKAVFFRLFFFPSYFCKVSYAFLWNACYWWLFERGYCTKWSEVGHSLEVTVILVQILSISLTTTRINNQRPGWME